MEPYATIIQERYDLGSVVVDLEAKVKATEEEIILEKKFPLHIVYTKDVTKREDDLIYTIETVSFLHDYSPEEEIWVRKHDQVKSDDRCIYIDVYNFSIEKVTRSDGYERKSLLQSTQGIKTPSLENWDKRVIEKLKLLPEHVQDVYGIENLNRE